MAAVTLRPADIHPYTVRRNAVTRSAAASAVTGGIRVAMESSMVLSSAFPISDLRALHRQVVKESEQCRHDARSRVGPSARTAAERGSRALRLRTRSGTSPTFQLRWRRR